MEYFGYISGMKNKNSINERQDEASSRNLKNNTSAVTGLPQSSGSEISLKRDGEDIWVSFSYANKEKYVEESLRIPEGFIREFLDSGKNTSKVFKWD